MLLKRATAILAARKAVKYLKDDLGHAYGLAEPAWAIFTGKGVGIGNAKAGSLSIQSEGADWVRLDAAPFAAESGQWNGPNLIPDDWGDGSLEASLWHDLIWGHSKELAAQLGRSEQAVMAWGDGILSAGWRAYARMYHPAKARRAGWASRAAYAVCEGARHVWHWFFAAALAVFVAGCSGGCIDPGWEVEDASAIRAGDPEAWQCVNGDEQCEYDNAVHHLRCECEPLAQCAMQDAQCTMQDAEGGMHNAQCTMHNEEGGEE